MYIKSISKVIYCPLCNTPKLHSSNTCLTCSFNYKPSSLLSSLDHFIQTSSEETYKDMEGNSHYTSAAIKEQGKCN